MNFQVKWLKIIRFIKMKYTTTKAVGVALLVLKAMIL